MSKPILIVEDLSKKYLIRHQTKSRYVALRDVLVDKTISVGRQILKGFNRQHSTQAREEFWALKNVNFEIQHGEVVGIIGRNGAGKSTLLKVLSRITEPTAGRIRLGGRVASLLEVGTGFHPELTGRENIYLNGAILGMSRAEIKQKFDEIVNFAEIEKFLDTAVKHYSSGMYVRLAFAVAAHLEPEILLIDEVLAVGDAAFQKRCIGKMEDVAHQGRTVLLVSHNMGIIGSLCPRTILLDSGRIVYNGETTSAIQKYIGQNLDSNNEVYLWDHPRRLPGMKPALLSARLTSKNEHSCSNFNIDDQWQLEVTYKNNSNQSFIGIGFGIYTFAGIRVCGFNTCMAQHPPYQIPAKGKVIFSLPSLNLCPGFYTITLSVGGNQQGYLYDKVEHVLKFKVEQNDVYGTGWILTPDDGVCALYADCKVIPMI